MTPVGLRLNFNENTAGCSPVVAAALQSLSRTDLATYPDALRITRRVEEWFGVDRGCAIVTNGLDEGILLLAQDALVRTEPGLGRPRTIVVEPTFEVYAIAARAVGSEVIHIKPRPQFEFPLEEILETIDFSTGVIYLTDPNNPTGLPIPPGSIEAIAARAASALVLVDEAYADFSGRTSIGPLLDRYPNLVVGRTFAKAYGLAGLRIGALVAARSTIARLERLILPFTVNICALRALHAALDDRSYVDWYVAQAAESRERIYDFCRARGMAFWPSEGNFVLVRIGDDVAAVVRELANRSILVRDRSASPGCAGCIRLTAGIVDHTVLALSALEDILASRPN